MADEEKTEEGGGESKGGLPMKLIIIVAVAMIIEGVVIAGVFMMAGGPDPAVADELMEDPLADAKELVELSVVADKFQNSRRGISFTYDTEIFIKVQRRYAEGVGDAPAEGEEAAPSGVVAEIERLQNTLRDDVAEIFREAEPAHLMETKLTTIKRQIKDAINERLGNDPDGEPYVVEVLIPKCQQYRSDL